MKTGEAVYTPLTQIDTYDEVMLELVRLRQACADSAQIPYERLVRLSARTQPSRALAGALCKDDCLSARILACLLWNPREMTEETAEETLRLFDFPRAAQQKQSGDALPGTRSAMRLATDWAERPEEQAVRAGFAMIGALTSHVSDEDGVGFYDNALFVARKQASLQSPLVRAAIVSALRQIAAVSPDWREAVAETCEEIAAQSSAAANGVAAEALAAL